MMIKDNINFLEYPLWVVDEKTKDTSFVIQEDCGIYELLCPVGLPGRLDKLILYYLIARLNEENGLTECSLTTTRQEIAENVFEGKRPGKKEYDRIMMALKKWNVVSLRFEGTFLEGGRYVDKSFSIIDEVDLDEVTDSLNIRFNTGYVEQLGK